MYIARILYPVEVLGPGLRVGIWLSGCERRCKACISPDLWERRGEQEFSVTSVMDIVNSIREKEQIDGFTISGGEPFLQTGELNILLGFLKDISEDILVYSGYTLEQLKALDDRDVESALTKIAVLIDGEYIDERNNEVILRGSDNQKIHIFNKVVKERYNKYCSKARNELQNFISGDAVVTVGIKNMGEKL